MRDALFTLAVLVVFLANLLSMGEWYRFKFRQELEHPPLLGGPHRPPVGGRVPRGHPGHLVARMTRIQLKGMTTRELIEFARLAHLNLMKPDGDLILELAERLDDVYPFNSDEQPQNVFNDFEKEHML